MRHQTERAFLAGELQLLEQLVGEHALRDQGLTTARLWLRHPGVVRDAVELDLGERRGIVLDKVCRATARRHPTPDAALRYFAGVGDLIQSAPADLRDVDHG